MKNWIEFFDGAHSMQKKKGLIQWSLFSGSFGSDDDLKSLKLVLASIKESKALLLRVNIENEATNHVFHPYSIRYYKGLFLVNGFSEKTKKLEVIPVRNIQGITATDAIPYRNPEDQDMETLTNVSFSQLTDNKNISKTITGMDKYWNEFNDYGAHQVGNRNQWFNEVRSLRFKGTNLPNSKLYFEICCQFGREEQLIINLMMTKKDGNAEGLENLAKRISNDLSEKLINAGFRSVNWERRKGKTRRTIELCSRKLPLENEDPRDPRIFPVQPTHFKWFNEKLDLLNVIFNDYLEN